MTVESGRCLYKKMSEQKRKSTGKGREIPETPARSHSPLFNSGVSSSSAQGSSGRIVPESPLVPESSNFSTPPLAPPRPTDADFDAQEISAWSREIWRIKLCVIYTSSNVQTVRVEGRFEDMESANETAESKYWAEWFGHSNLEPTLRRLLESQRLTQPYQALGRSGDGARHISCCVFKDEEGEPRELSFTG